MGRRLAASDKGNEWEPSRGAQGPFVTPSIRPDAVVLDDAKVSYQNPLLSMLAQASLAVSALSKR